MTTPPPGVPIELTDAYQLAQQWVATGRQPWRLAAELLAAYKVDHGMDYAEERALNLTRRVLAESTSPFDDAEREGEAGR